MTKADFVVVGSFPNRALAHLAAESLRAFGIEARIEGGDVHGIAPVTGSDVRVLVSSDSAVEARALLESVPATSVAASSAPSSRVASSIGLKFALAGLLLLAAVLGLKLQDARSVVDYAYGSGPYEEPYWRDRCVVSNWRGTRTIALETCDSDGDGVRESTKQFGRNGKLLSESTDSNDNGTPERSTVFDAAGKPAATHIDTGEDGVQETVLIFDRYGREVARAEDPDNDGRTDTWTETDVQGSVTKWTDNFGDGIADEMVRTNAAGVIVQRLKDTPEGWKETK